MQLCLKKLDDSSHEFRIAAEDMANFLRSLKNIPREIQELEVCFRKVKTAPIAEIDLCLKNIEREFLKLSLKELDGKTLMSNLLN